MKRTLIGLAVLMGAVMFWPSEASALSFVHRHHYGFGPSYRHHGFHHYGHYGGGWWGHGYGGYWGHYYDFKYRSYRAAKRSQYYLYHGNDRSLGHWYSGKKYVSGVGGHRDYRGVGYRYRYHRYRHWW